jgi:hypothetical protein
MPVRAVAGGVLASQTATGGHAIPVTLSTSTSQIIGTNGQRLSIVFHNPGSVTAYVAPATTATGGPLTPSLAALAGTFQIVSGGTLVLSGEVQCAWQGFATSTGSSLSILESNI